MTTLPIAPHELEERSRLRTCATCSAFDKGRCRRGSPGPAGWPEVDGATDYCLEWSWVINPRVVWNSAIAPRERDAESTILTGDFGL